MPIPIIVPRLGWSMEQGTFIGWLKKNGDAVRALEPLYTLEGDKASQDVEATDNGTLHIPPGAPQSGSTVAVGAILGYLLLPNETPPNSLTASAPGTPPTPSTLEKPSAVPPAQTAAAPTPPGNTPLAATSAPPTLDTPANISLPSAPRSLSSRSPSISPRALRKSAELGVDWTRVHGTGRTGRIREKDILASAHLPPNAPSNLEPTASQPPIPGRLIPLTPLRRTIARRMSAAVHEAAPVTLHSRADATQLVRLRQRLKFAADNSPADIPSFTDILLHLAAASLQQHPLLNAQWHENGIFIPDEIHIAIAVDTEDGLLAPVLRNAARLSLPQITAASRALIESARARRLPPDQLQGGTFTITNLGSFGIDAFTPILNLPQCAVLGIGSIRPEPVVLGAEIVIRDMLTLSLTFDHRIVDGAPAARFLQTLRSSIESADS